MPNRPKTGRPFHRPRREVHDQVLQLIARLISLGHSDRMVQRITTVRSDQWKRFAKENRRLDIRKDGVSKKVSFRTILDQAERSRNGNLALKLIDAVHKGIEKQNVYCMKVAMHNFETGLRDPDVLIPVKQQKRMDRLAARESDIDAAAVDAAMEAAAAPSHSAGAVVQPGPVQDSAGGSSIGQDGVGQAETDNGSVGLPSGPGTKA